MKKIVVFLLVSMLSMAQNTQEINVFLDNWHLAAAQAKFENYFQALDQNSIFIGTDATENWTKPQFEAFAKPFFEKGKTWNFKTLQRNVYFTNNQTVYFDELLDTQMKICRGSGVLVKTKKGWKIKHYVLSMTVPNENVSEIVKIKSNLETVLIKNLQTKASFK